TPADDPTRTAPAGPHRGSGFDEELRRLLRSRLLLVHLLTFVFLLLLSVMMWLTPQTAADRTTARTGVSLGQVVPALGPCLIGAVILWRSPGISLRFLRLWELLLLAGTAVLQGMIRFQMLVQVGDGHPDPASVDVGFRGLASLQGPIAIILAY